MQSSLPTLSPNYSGLFDPSGMMAKSHVNSTAPNLGIPRTPNSSPTHHRPLTDPEMSAEFPPLALLLILGSFWGIPKAPICFSVPPPATHESPRPLPFGLFDASQTLLFLHPLPRSEQGWHIPACPGSWQWPLCWCVPPGARVPTLTARLIFFF